MSALATTFPCSRKRNTQAYKHAAKAILSLSSKTVIKGREGAQFRRTVVSCDDALAIAIGVWEDDHAIKTLDAAGAVRGMFAAACAKSRVHRSVPTCGH